MHVRAIKQQVAKESKQANITDADSLESIVAKLTGVCESPFIIDYQDGLSVLTCSHLEVKAGKVDFLLTNCTSALYALIIEANARLEAYFRICIQEEAESIFNALHGQEDQA